MFTHTTVCIDTNNLKKKMRLAVVACSFNPSTHEVEVGESEFQVIESYTVRPHLKEKKERKKLEMAE